MTPHSYACADPLHPDHAEIRNAILAGDVARATVLLTLHFPSVLDAAGTRIPQHAQQVVGLGLEQQPEQHEQREWQTAQQRERPQRRAQQQQPPWIPSVAPRHIALNLRIQSFIEGLRPSSMSARRTGGTAPSDASPGDAAPTAAAPTDAAPTHPSSTSAPTPSSSASNLDADSLTTHPSSTSEPTSASTNLDASHSAPNSTSPSANLDASQPASTTTPTNLKTDPAPGPTSRPPADALKTRTPADALKTNLALGRAIHDEVAALADAAYTAEWAMVGALLA